MLCLFIFHLRTKDSPCKVIFSVFRGFRVAFSVPNRAFLSFKTLMLKTDPSEGKRKRRFTLNRLVR